MKKTKYGHNYPVPTNQIQNPNLNRGMALHEYPRICYCDCLRSHSKVNTSSEWDLSPLNTDSWILAPQSRRKRLRTTVVLQGHNFRSFVPAWAVHFANKHRRTSFLGLSSNRVSKLSSISSFSTEISFCPAPNLQNIILVYTPISHWRVLLYETLRHCSTKNVV